MAACHARGRTTLIAMMMVVCVLLEGPSSNMSTDFSADCSRAMCRGSMHACMPLRCAAVAGAGVWRRVRSHGGGDQRGPHGARPRRQRHLHLLRAGSCMHPCAWPHGPSARLHAMPRRDDAGQPVWHSSLLAGISASHAAACVRPHLACVVCDGCAALRCNGAASHHHVCMHACMRAGPRRPQLLHDRPHRRRHEQPAPAAGELRERGRVRRKDGGWWVVACMPATPRAAPFSRHPKTQNEPGQADMPGGQPSSDTVAAMHPRIHCSGLRYAACALVLPGRLSGRARWRSTWPRCAQRLWRELT